MNVNYDNKLKDYSNDRLVNENNKKCWIAVTIDYETWHPIPDKKSINWDHDVFKPAMELLELANREEIKLTLLAEMGEYFWLKQNEPTIAHQMEIQWRTFIQQGHDVQLHLHPNWLPELGATYQDGQWSWDWSRAKAHDYPGNLTQLTKRCKDTLESLLQPINPNYRVTSFRAGAYQAQPFKRLYDALVDNQIFCDSSVYAGGHSTERGYDYRLAYSRHQPYFANAYDPQLLAPPSESKIVELPIFTFNLGERWFLDGSEGAVLATRLLQFLQNKLQSIPSSESQRFQKKLARLLTKLYIKSYKIRSLVNRLLPKSLAYLMVNSVHKPELKQEYFVLIGHTKGEHSFDEVAKNLRLLREDSRFHFVTLSEMAITAHQDLVSQLHSSSKEEAEYQVQREYKAVMGCERNAAQSYYLQALIPLDRKSLLDLGCGSGYWSDRIAKLYPWMSVTGVDYGADFIEKAKETYSSEKTTFQVENFQNLSFGDETFDCIYADNTLEHAYDVDQVLSETYRVLRPGGVLVAAIPCDAYNPEYVCDNHTWKTAPHEVLIRLEHTGFHNITIQEIDTYRQLGMSPYPPSRDRMMYITAWKYDQPQTHLQRVLDVMNWVYHNISPEKAHRSNDPCDILSYGYGWCAASSAVMAYILKHEGYRTRMLTFFIKPHPKGHGTDQIDSHTCLEVKLDGQWQLFDPMSNVYFQGYSFKTVVNTPALVSQVLQSHQPDKRFIERSYSLYCSEWAYRNCYAWEYELEGNTISKILKKLLTLIKS